MQRYVMEVLSDSRGAFFQHYVSDPLNRAPGYMTFTPQPIPIPEVSTETIEILGPSKIEWKDPKHDKESFNKIRRSGSIKMTRYKVGKISTKHFWGTKEGTPIVLKAGWAIMPTAKNSWEWQSFRDPGQYFVIDYAGWVGEPYQRYTFRMPDNHFAYRINERFTLLSLSLRVYDLRDSLDCTTEVEQLKSDLSTALHKRWDALTDLLEGRQTLTMLKGQLAAALSPLASFKALRDKIRRKPFKGSEKVLREKWLEFRYGILPIMLSIQDYQKLQEEKEHEYLTERRRISIGITNSGSPPNAECIYIKHFGTIEINGTAKARFVNPSSRLFAGISMNIVNSVWEKIPYSLVVDWFVNVGDYLYNQSSSWLPPSFDSMMCYSVKRRITTHTYARIKNLDGSFQDHLLREEVEESYGRVPFNQSDIKLVFNPRFSSWKRWLDAYALGILALIRAFRRLY